MHKTCGLDTCPTDISRIVRINYNWAMDSQPSEIPKPEHIPETTSEHVPVPQPPSNPASPSAGTSAKPAAPEDEDVQPRRRRALVLLLLTCVSTFLVAFYERPVFPNRYFFNFLLVTPRSELWEHFWHGLTYSGCLMAILGAHELGHYLQAVRYGVSASLPYFIPFPISPFGTMGAIIVQQPDVADRKVMFDIAVSGPLAGLVVALPLTYWGIVKSDVLPIASSHSDILFGEPLLLSGMVNFIRGPIPEDKILAMSPMLFAGWVGIFITAINLIPIGQLDGGHLTYCLMGRRAHHVAHGVFLLALGAVGYGILKENGRGAIWSLISYVLWIVLAREILFWLIRRHAHPGALGLFVIGGLAVVVFTMAAQGRYAGWSVMLYLIWMFGIRHPPTANDRARLGWVRIALGWVTLSFLVIGLTPTPIAEFKPQPKSRPPARRHFNTEVRIDVKLQREALRWRV